MIYELEWWLSDEVAFANIYIRSNSARKNDLNVSFSIFYVLFFFWSVLLYFNY